MLTLEKGFPFHAAKDVEYRIKNWESCLMAIEISLVQEYLTRYAICALDDCRERSLVSLLYYLCKLE